VLQHGFSWLRIVLNQPTRTRLWGSSGDPAIDGAKNGKGSSLFRGAGGVERYNAGEDNESAALSGFNRDDDVTPSKEIGERNTLEPKADGIDDLGSSGEGGAGGGSDAADG
jgi:hypothetical protein